MKLQDQYPYDSAIWGLDNLYSTVGVDSFYINNSCVVAKDHTITTGKTYMLILHSENGQVVNRMVRLVDVYNDNININLVLCDAHNEDGNNIKLNVRNRNYNCPWMLIDVKYFQNEIERLRIGNYCGC
jgi:hypothetical protein